MAEAEAVAGCEALGFSARLALHLARSYSAAELAWLLEETAGRAQHPQSYARRLARELEAGTSGPGIARPAKQRRRRGRKALRQRGRSAVDRLNASLEAGASGQPAPPMTAEELERFKVRELELNKQVEEQRRLRDSTPLWFDKDSGQWLNVFQQEALFRAQPWRRPT